MNATSPSIARAFAVVPNLVNRKSAIENNPLSPSWSLYNPADLAEKLGLPLDVVEAALVETGFAKAVHVRMEVLRWKERLRLEDRALNDRIRSLDAEKRALKTRQAQVHEALHGCRNILRLPRDASAMSTGTAKTPKAVEGQSPASATRQGDAQTNPQSPHQQERAGGVTASGNSNGK